MKNSPYRDKPLVSLAAALRVHAGGNRGKNHNGSPRRKARLQQRATLLREWLTPRSPIRS